MGRTRWSPDTCGCVIEYEYDDTLPVESRELTPRSVEPCAFHRLDTDQAVFDAVLEENRRKNTAYAIALEEIPVLTPDDFEWSFDNKRVLNVHLRNVGTSFTGVQARCDPQLVRFR